LGKPLFEPVEPEQVTVQEIIIPVASTVAGYRRDRLLSSTGYNQVFWILLIFCYFLAVQSPVANVFLHFQDLSGATSQNKYLLAMPTWMEYTARATFA
jgi:hypothetical protein